MGLREFFGLGQARDKPVDTVGGGPSFIFGSFLGFFFH